MVDETQDFSANDLRAVLAHADEDASVTFVIDAAQQIYKKGFTWKEVGVDTPTVRTLKVNYRNTKEIAAFARPLMKGVSVGADGTLPDLKASTRSGPKPVVLEGKYSKQLSWARENVVAPANLASESVGFLTFRGGGWNTALENAIDRAGVERVELTRQSVWPEGDETVAISTLYSAKGLEFDHVVILGVSQQVTPHGDDDDDTDLDSLRRLLAMGIGRARKTVTVGYKPGAPHTAAPLRRRPPPRRGPERVGGRNHHPSHRAASPAARSSTLFAPADLGCVSCSFFSPITLRHILARTTRAGSCHGNQAAAKLQPRRKRRNIPGPGVKNCLQPRRQGAGVPFREGRRRERPLLTTTYFFFLNNYLLLGSLAERPRTLEKTGQTPAKVPWLHLG